MPDAAALADLGRASIQAVWVPVALWTAVALAVEAGLRVGQAPAALALPVRGAALAALPLSLAIPAALGAWAPQAALAVADWTPGLVWLPEVAVGDASAVVPAPPASLDAVGVVLGLALVAAGLLALVHLARLAWEAVGVRNGRRALAPADAAGQSAVDDARRRLGVSRPVAAVVSPPGAAPFTVGWRRPVVALPADLDGAAREVAALHEVAHVRRADFAWHALQRAVVAAFAAHPLVWALARRLDLDRERAADALVLAACPGRRRTYADLLFSYAARPAPALAVGAVGGPSSLKHRIDAMTSPLTPFQSRRLARWGRLASFVTLATVAGLAATASPLPDRDPTGVHQTPPPTPNADVQRVAPPPPPSAGSLEPTRADSVDAIERIEVRTGQSIHIHLKPEYGLDAAESVVNGGRWKPGEDSLVVHYEGGVLERLVDLSDARPPNPGSVSPSSGSRSQPAGTPGIFEVAEVQPALVGGIAALQERVVYPPSARADGVEGTVYVQFVVGTDGRVTDATAVRSPDDRLAAAALAAVRASAFEPGRQRGEPVRVRFAVPVTFRLPGDQGSRRDRMVSDTKYSDDLESFLEVHESLREFAKATIRSRVAVGSDPFADLIPGTARVRFRIQDNGAPLIESVDASVPVMERYGRLKALTTQFRTEAAGRSGTMTVTVSRVD